MSKYIPDEYWAEHFRKRPGLLGTGHRRFTLEYNIKMYEVATEQLQQALARSDVNLTNARVLDVGSGFGYYVNRYLAWGAQAVTGVDLTQQAVDHLKATFPGQEFHQADISEPGWEVGKTYDLVSAISMIFHIVEPARFRSALTNLCRHVVPGGHLLVVDSFQRQWLPTAPHARLRDLADYRPVLEAEGLELVGLYPMHFLMGRALIPVIGPALFNQPLITRLLAGLERQLLRSGLSPAWLNFLIAVKRG